MLDLEYRTQDLTKELKGYRVSTTVPNFVLCCHLNKLVDVRFLLLNKKTRTGRGLRTTQHGLRVRIHFLYTYLYT